MSPFTNSSLRWLPGEPSDSGFCAYLEEPQASGLKANPCTATAHGLICEKATGERHAHTTWICYLDQKKLTLHWIITSQSLIWKRLIFLSFCLILSCPGNPNQSTRPSCKKPCSMHTNCANCTNQAMECMWCGSAQRCVDSTAYVISFPYGQCLEWQTGDCVGKCLLLNLI